MSFNMVAVGKGTRYDGKEARASHRSVKGEKAQDAQLVLCSRIAQVSYRAHSISISTHVPPAIVGRLNIKQTMKQGCQSLGSSCQILDCGIRRGLLGQRM